MSYTTLKTHASFGGQTIFAEHSSEATKTKMKFSAFLPQPADQLDSAIIWLSGLTCNEENFITKAGGQALLAGTKTMVICPDTSPRGLDLPNEHDSWDFGSAASFYVNATTDGYRNHYQMADYLTKDLITLLKDDFGVSKLGITGHSMGGHGAMTLGIRENQLFRSVSAFAPIVNPMECPWGQKAFSGYLGSDREQWRQYDACELLKSGHKAASPILIDQGSADTFLEKELLTANFEEAARNAAHPAEVHYRDGYDHSYYFIASFLKNHIEFHLKHLS